MICAARLPRFLKQLGGAFPKAGQILSTRSDLLPELICQALARLQDDTSPMPHKQVEQALQMDGIGERVLFWVASDGECNNRTGAPSCAMAVL